MNVELDLDKYDLDDLLNLFGLTREMTLSDLKKAYKMVLMTHPDKSRLDKKYFLFFSKAFKLIKKIYEYSNKKEECVTRNRNFIYNTSNLEIENLDLDKLHIKDKTEFNKKFNKIFDKVKFEDDEQDNGYDEWLKSDENIYELQNNMNINDMSIEINKIKSTQRNIIRHEGIIEMNSGSYSNMDGYGLTREKPKEYTSGMFSKLQYQDVKKAHSETVIPVTEEDFNNRKHFSNTNELEQYRHQNESILSKEEYERKLNEKNNNEATDNINRAYKMMKQMEKIERSNKLFTSHFKLLTN